jgi:D-arginine dehydrogenase
MTDIVVIGGGIAGVTAAAHLSHDASVTLLEMESSLAYHTTGRSAALLVVNYGGRGVRPLTRASRAFFESPPEGSTDASLLSDRGAMFVSDEARMDRLEKLAREGEDAGANSALMTAEEVIEMVPTMSPDFVAGGLLELDAQDIDVAGLHQAFVRIARKHNAEINTGEPVNSISKTASGWVVKTRSAEYPCDIVVNAAGAWGDVVATMAGVDPVGLEPKRRTAFMVPGHLDYAQWPAVADVDTLWYFKPDGVQMLCSLGEENLSEPADVKPRMEDVALAIERINGATRLNIRAVSSEWTGLRTFAPDRELVVGEEPGSEGFFWLVGQGGTGIGAAPAYGSMLASQVLGTDLDPELLEAGVDPAITSPDRLR